MDSIRICSLAIAGQHLSIIRQVHGLCLGLTGRLREKNGQKVRGQAPYVDPAPEKVGVNWPPGPRGSAAPGLAGAAAAVVVADDVYSYTGGRCAACNTWTELNMAAIPAANSEIQPSTLSNRL